VKILFVGDVFGKPGKQAAAEVVPRLKKELGIDLCIINGENSAGGFGLTETSAEKLLSYGADVITSGNHIFDRPDAFNVLTEHFNIIRPANYPPGLPGRGEVVVETPSGTKVAVINLQGRIFMPPIDCPFRTADQVIDRIWSETPVIIVDFHAEATSEKMAMGWYLDGKVSAIIGTHTHVMTADERILPGGTAYITDAGMTGPHDSVIGVKIHQSVERIIKQVHVRFSPADKGLEFNGVVLEIDDATGKALSIKRIIEKVADG
jgi:metallophosphoesterase (TIGR00282 family)